MIKPEEISTLYQKLKSHIARDFRPSAVTQNTIIGGGGATSFSGLTGTIANAQAPQFLLRDGSRSLTGSLSVDAGVTIAGVDISAHAANVNAHHNQQHSVTGSDHTITGAALSLVGATAINTLGLITPSNNPGTTESVLKATSGLLTLPNFTATTSMRTPLIDTASGSLTLSPANSTTAITGALSLTGTLSSTSWNITSAGAATLVTATASTSVTTPTVTTASGNLTLTSVGGTVAVTGALTGSSTAAFTGTVTTPTVSTASGNLTLTSVGGTVAVTGALTGSSTATITGVTSIASGSVGAPGLTFTGDTNTGIYRSGTDAYSLVAGGAAIINVGATGAGVNAAYDSTAALKVQSVANDDITLFLKQKSGQTARMWRVEDSVGQELIVLDSQGNLQSGNPGFVSGLTGWQITPTGTAEFNNVWVRGELHASIFVMDEFHASGGTLYIAPAGKLELDATIYTTTGVEAILDIRTTSVSGSGSQLDIRTTSGAGSGTQITSRWIENYFEITDPPSGHAMILAAGDIVRCKALGLGVGIDLWDVWGVVGRVEDMTDYYRYYYERKSGGTNGLIIPAGTAIISYGAPGDGRIYLTADQNYAPYMQVFLTGVEPWNGDIRPTMRIGRLDGVGLPGVSGIEQYGMVTSTDLSDASAPYIVNSNLQMFSYNVDSEWNNGNPTARITSGGVFKLGTDIDSAATTGLDFNPITGALTIGSASYPGTVTVYGSITVTGGSGYGNFSDKPTSLSSINSTEGTKLAGIASGATVGATWGTNLNSVPTRFGEAPVSAGLYLTPTHLGYYNGSAWKAWIASSGEFYFGGNSGAHLEWNGTKLRGIGTDGTTEQWYADATDGKFYAGNGALQLDRTALHVANSVTSKGIQFYNTATFTDANKAGRLWALSGTPYSMYLTGGRSTFDGDSTNAAGQIQMYAYKSNGVSGASIELSGSTQIAEITATEIDMFGDLDMNGYDIIDANNIISIRTTA